MIRYLLAASILTTFVTLPMNGQGTMVILLDVYQNPSEEDPSLTEQMILQAERLVESHRGSVYSHFCDPYHSNHYSYGRQDVLSHLDSISSQKIPMPQRRSNWQHMAKPVIETLIEQERHLDTDTIAVHLITCDDSFSRFESNLVSTLAHVFNFTDDTGEFSRRLSVVINSYSSGQTSPMVTQITSLK